MGGGGVLCSALVFASISISALRYDGVIGCFAEMVKAITSASRDGFHRHVFSEGCLRVCLHPELSSVFHLFCFTVQVGRFSSLGRSIAWDLYFKGNWTS